MKKQVVTAGVVALIFLFGKVNAQTLGYEDIDDHYATDIIVRLRAVGIYDPFILEGETKFNPDAPITRVKFLMMMIQALGIDIENREDPPFKDFDDIAESYKPYVAAGYHSGLMEGVEENGERFSYWDRAISRQEVALILSQFTQESSFKPLTFSDDSQIGEWAKPAVYQLVGNGVLSGYPDGRFDPHRETTMAEASVMIDKAYQNIYGASIKPGGQLSKNSEMSVKRALDSSFGHQNNQLIGPKWLSKDANGAVYVVDGLAGVIKRLKDGSLLNVIGGENRINNRGIPVSGYKDDVVGKEAVLNMPSDAVMNEEGDIFFTDTGNHIIRVMRRSTGKVGALSGKGVAGYANGAASQTQYSHPTGLAIDKEGNLYVADTQNHCIRKVAPNGVSSLYAGSPGSQGGKRDGQLDAALFKEPTGLFMDTNGDLYVADTGNHAIRVIQEGTVKTVVGGLKAGFEDGSVDTALLNGPRGLSVAEDGRIYIADTENHRIRVLDHGVVRTIAGNGEAGEGLGGVFNKPYDVLEHQGVLYISDYLGGSIKLVRLK